MNKIEFDELLSVVEFLFGRSEGDNGFGLIGQIKSELENYLTCTRWIDTSINLAELREAFFTMGYTISNAKESSGNERSYCNADITKTIKLLHLMRPIMDEEIEGLISDNADFTKAYGIALRDLIEGNPEKEVQLYVDEDGLYTIFTHNNQVLKLQLYENVPVIYLLT